MCNARDRRGVADRGGRGLALVLVVSLLQFTIELMVTRNYTLASILITATALTIAACWAMDRRGE